MLQITIPASELWDEKNQKFTKCNIKEIEVKKDVVLDNPMFYIKWRLFNACNYHCSYCIRKDLDKANNTFDTLIEYAKKLNSVKIPFRLELIGGEPTLIDLKKLISYIENKNLKSIYIYLRQKSAVPFLFFPLKYKRIHLHHILFRFYQ